MLSLKTTASAVAVLVALSSAANAAECGKVTFSDVGWTDITATTAATTVVLDALGYETNVKILSVPVTYVAMSGGDVDVFLGNWMPTMEGDIQNTAMKAVSILSVPTWKVRNTPWP